MTFSVAQSERRPATPVDRRQCRVCDASGRHETYLVREMMYGMDETFEYFQCRECGCLQLAEVPADLSRYYPDNYYSYNLDTIVPKKPGALKDFLKRKRLDAWLKGDRAGPVARLLGKPFVSDHFLEEIAEVVPLRSSDRIVDFGCGNGHRLLLWRLAGFGNLVGIDPFIEKDIDYGNGVRIRKARLEDVESGTADLVMGYHSLEHIPDAIGTLAAIGQMLQADGWAALAIPICDSYAWQEYRTDWVALDAPRHIYLHTVKSMTVLAERCRFSVEKVIRNSCAMQFWGSEQYRAGIPLMDRRSYLVNPAELPFSEPQIKAWQAESVRLNAEGTGDWATFYLRKQRDVDGGVDP